MTHYPSAFRGATRLRRCAPCGASRSFRPSGQFLNQLISAGARPTWDSIAGDRPCQISQARAWWARVAGVAMHRGFAKIRKFPNFNFRVRAQRAPSTRGTVDQAGVAMQRGAQKFQNFGI